MTGEFSAKDKSLKDVLISLSPDDVAQEMLNVALNTQVNRNEDFSVGLDTGKYRTVFNPKVISNQQLDSKLATVEIFVYRHFKILLPPK